MIRSLAFLIFAAADVATAVVHAETAQSFAAQVGDIALEAGDAEITLVPIGRSFSLNASTRGASLYPPPKTRIDRLSIVCDGFTEGKALLLDHRSFERSVCDVTSAARRSSANSASLLRARIGGVGRRAMMHDGRVGAGAHIGRKARPVGATRAEAVLDQRLDLVLVHPRTDARDRLAQRLRRHVCGAA